jgi:hypothetical protein
MAADHFFARWARPKPESAQTPNQAPPLAAALPLASATDSIDLAQPPVAPPLLSMDDVAQLTMDSDYAPFIARGVDQAVQRGAMKKLFADPHFNLMDGLDIYIGDYNTFEPIPAAMLALLEHAKGVLDPLSMFEQPVMQLVSTRQPESKPDPESKLEPEQEPKQEPQIMAEIEPPLEPPLDPPLDPQLEPASLAEPESALDCAPPKTLPDTDEHTIQGL